MVSIKSYFTLIVFPGQLSVLNGEAGRPSLLKRFGWAVFDQANLTATGFLIFGLEATIVFPSIWASAGTNLPFRPAMVKSVSGPFFAISPEPVWLK